MARVRRRTQRFGSPSGEDDRLGGEEEEEEEGTQGRREGKTGRGRRGRRKHAEEEGEEEEEDVERRRRATSAAAVRRRVQELQREAKKREESGDLGTQAFLDEHGLTGVTDIRAFHANAEEDAALLASDSDESEKEYKEAAARRRRRRRSAQEEAEEGGGTSEQAQQQQEQNEGDDEKENKGARGRSSGSAPVAGKGASSSFVCLPATSPLRWHWAVLVAGLCQEMHHAECNAAAEECSGGARIPDVLRDVLTCRDDSQVLTALQELLIPLWFQRHPTENVPTTVFHYLVLRATRPVHVSVPLHSTTSPASPAATGRGAARSRVELRDATGLHVDVRVMRGAVNTFVHMVRDMAQAKQRQQQPPQQNLEQDDALSGPQFEPYRLTLEDVSHALQALGMRPPVVSALLTGADSYDVKSHPGDTAHASSPSSSASASSQSCADRAAQPVSLSFDTVQWAAGFCNLMDILTAATVHCAAAWTAQEAAIICRTLLWLATDDNVRSHCSMQVTRALCALLVQLMRADASSPSPPPSVSGSSASSSTATALYREPATWLPILTPLADAFRNTYMPVRGLRTRLCELVASLADVVPITSVWLGADLQVEHIPPFLAQGAALRMALCDVLLRERFWRREVACAVATIEEREEEKQEQVMEADGNDADSARDDEHHRSSGVLPTTRLSLVSTSRQWVDFVSRKYTTAFVRDNESDASDAEIYTAVSLCYLMSMAGRTLDAAAMVEAVPATLAAPASTTSSPTPMEQVGTAAAAAAAAETAGTEAELQERWKVVHKGARRMARALRPAVFRSRNYINACIDILELWSDQMQVDLSSSV